MGNLPTIKTIPCAKGGFCEFTVAKAHDLHCRKCDAPAAPIIDQLEPDNASEGFNSEPLLY